MRRLPGQARPAIMPMPMPVWLRTSAWAASGASRTFWRPALSGGRGNVLEAPEGAQAEVRSQTGMGLGMIAGLAWPGCLRKLDRESPGYAD